MDIRNELQGTMADEELVGSVRELLDHQFLENNLDSIRTTLMHVYDDLGTISLNGITKPHRDVVLWTSKSRLVEVIKLIDMTKEKMVK